MGNHKPFLKIPRTGHLTALSQPQQHAERGTGLYAAQPLTRDVSRHHHLPDRPGDQLPRRRPSRRTGSTQPAVEENLVGGTKSSLIMVVSEPIVESA